MLKIFLLICSIWALTRGNVIPDSSSCLRCKCSNKVSNPKIVIIGAGAAGIACATKLLEYGFTNIQVLEAESRIGGRINTIPFGGKLIELGAQFVHGQQRNVVYELVSKYDFIEPSSYYEYQSIRSNREILPESLNKRLKDIGSNHDNDYLRKSNESFGRYVAHTYYKTLLSEKYSDVDRIVAKEFLESFKRFESSEDGPDYLEEVSARARGEFDVSEGHPAMYWKERGYVEFLRLLLKTYELGTELGVLRNRVKLSKVVTKIKWNKQRLNAAIICKDGETIIADHVILTVSLGVLKQQHLDLFEPHLPAEKIRAIDYLRFGTVNKIFLEFSKPFWPANWTGFLLLWLDADLIEVLGTSRAWLEDVFHFHPVNKNSSILQGWVKAPGARQVETLSMEKVLADCMFLLRKFLAWDIPEPLNVVITKWYTNVNFRGTWSFRSVETYDVGTSASELAKPLTSKGAHCNKSIVRVQFAGEATSEHKFGMVHGATETGWREAVVLAKLYGKMPVKQKRKYFV